MSKLDEIKSAFEQKMDEKVQAHTVRLEAELSELRADLEGEATGQGTLPDPLIGLFDSGCNLIAFNDDNGFNLNSRLVFTIPGDGIFILAATSYPDFNFIGEGGSASTYRITIAEHYYYSFLPTVLRLIFSEQEDNDDYPQANGPMRLNQDYLGYHDDESDWFYHQRPAH